MAKYETAKCPRCGAKRDVPVGTQGVECPKCNYRYDHVFERKLAKAVEVQP